MYRTCLSFISFLLCAVSCVSPAAAQVAPATILEIDVESYVGYIGDIFDASKYATESSVTTAPTARFFLAGLFVADIVAVNGKSAKGTLLIRTHGVLARPEPTTGQAIADTVRNHVADSSLEILQSDGTPIGTIVALGVSGGVPPPGAPAAQAQGNNAIAVPVR